MAAQMVEAAAVEMMVVVGGWMGVAGGLDGGRRMVVAAEMRWWWEVGFVLLFEVLLDVARSGHSGLLYRLLITDMDTGASSMMNFRMMNQECVKLDKFDGCTYTRWAEKIKFLLIVLKIYYVLDPELPPIPANSVPKPGKPMDEKKVSELKKQRMIHKENETL
ncbi:hypothetical protein Tco_0899979 [Tanacetum coccineum]